MLAVRSLGNPDKHSIAVTPTFPWSPPQRSERQRPRVMIWELPEWALEECRRMLSLRASMPTTTTGMFLRSRRVTPPLSFLVQGPPYRLSALLSLLPPGKNKLSSEVMSPSGPSKKSMTLSHSGATSSELVTTVRQHARQTQRPVLESPTSMKCLVGLAKRGSKRWQPAHRRISPMTSSDVVVFMLFRPPPKGESMSSLLRF
mmetsp:Transcript_23054/g.37428  ORF Transcript_23054/g.37428 Transcript_23054/m.37428 type:complete len:202 (-) Transcript_23054:59-664(-)